MKCHTCFRGAPADAKKEHYFCTVKGGMRSINENRQQYLERSRVPAQLDCSAYLSREYFEGVPGK